MKQQTAQLNHLHIAPRKVRLLANTLKGLPVQEAEAQLLMRTQRAAGPLLKLLRSAIANSINNQRLERNKLFVSKIVVNQGPVLKRFLPRAMGRATPLHKRTSHVTLMLGELEKASSPRFDIAPPIKKEKKTKKETAKKPKIQEKRREAAKKEKGGFLKRLFRRKSV